MIWVIFELTSFNDIGEIKMRTENAGRNRHLNRKTQDKPEEYKEKREKTVLGKTEERRKQ